MGKHRRISRVQSSAAATRAHAAGRPGRADPRRRAAINDAANHLRVLFERRCWTPLAAAFEKAPLRWGGRVPVSAPGPAVPDAAGWVGVKSHLGSGVLGGVGYAVSPHGHSPLSIGRRGSLESCGARPFLLPPRIGTPGTTQENR
jgi:hypothetical protein